MQLVITLRKEVSTRQEGEDIYELVKSKLQDRPAIEITGHVTNHFLEDEEPS